MNIKHWIGIGGASLALLFAGCTFGGEEDTSVKVSNVEQKVQDNPEELFFEFAKASGQNGLDVLEKSIPNKEILRKVEGFFTVDGEFNLEGTPLGGGEGTFGIRVDSLADYTNSDNIQAKDQFSIQADVMGGLFKLDTKGEVRVVKDSIFAQISDLDFNFPMVDPETEKIILSFVGQWYGNTFEEITELVGDDSFNLKDIMVGPVNAVPELLTLLEDVLRNPENHVVFNSYVKEENGYYFFTATPKKETYKKLGDIAVSVLPFPEYEKESFEQMIDSLELSPITIGYTPENSEYFKLSRVDDNASVSLEKTADGVSFVIKEEGIETVSFVYSNQTKEFTLTQTDTGGEKEGEASAVKVLAKGNWDGENFSFEAFDPSSYSEEMELIAKGSAQYNKEGKSWSAEFESPAFPEAKLQLANFSFVASDTQVFTGEIQGIMSDNTVAKITIASEMKVPGSLQVDTPENAKPFTSIPEDIAKMEEERYQKLQEELEQEAEVIDESAESEQDPFKDGNDGIVPAETEENPVGGPAGEDTPENNPSSTLQPLISELIRQMGESPTPENVAKAEELKNIIFSVGADEGVSPTEIQSLIQAELQKNPPLPQ